MDLLVFIALLHDVIVERTIHPVYRIGVPLLVLGQVTATVILIQQPAAWMSWAVAIVQ